MPEHLLFRQCGRLILILPERARAGKSRGRAAIYRRRGLPILFIRTVIEKWLMEPLAEMMFWLQFDAVALSH